MIKLKKLFLIFIFILAFMGDTVYAADIPNNHVYFIDTFNFNSNNNTISISGYSFISHADNIGKTDSITVNSTTKQVKKNLNTYIIAYDKNKGWDSSYITSSTCNGSSSNCYRITMNHELDYNTFYWGRCVKGTSVNNCTNSKYIQALSRGNGNYAYKHDNDTLYEYVNFKGTLNLADIEKKLTGNSSTKINIGLKIASVVTTSEGTHKIASDVRVYKGICKLNGSNCGSMGSNNSYAIKSSGYYITMSNFSDKALMDAGGARLLGSDGKRYFKESDYYFNQGTTYNILGIPSNKASVRFENGGTYIDWIVNLDAKADNIRASADNDGTSPYYALANWVVFNGDLKIEIELDCEVGTDPRCTPYDPEPEPEPEPKPEPKPEPEPEDKKGNVCISKKVKGKNDFVSGATLVVKDASGNVIKEWVSSNQKYCIYEMKPGDYYLTEKKAPDGYVLNNERKKFTIKNDGSTIEVTMENTPEEKKGNVCISKKEKDSNRFVSGATLSIKDSSGNVIKEWVSTSQKHCIYGMEPGKYYLTETEAPEGYELSTERIEFTVKDDGSTTEVTMENSPKQTGGVCIKKIDKDTGRMLGGAKLVVRNSSGAEVVTVESSASSSSCIDEMEPGTYTLTERKAPEGYILSDEVKRFTVRAGGSITEVVMGNTKPKDITCREAGFDDYSVKSGEVDCGEEKKLNECTNYPLTGNIYIKTNSTCSGLKEYINGSYYISATVSAKALFNQTGKFVFGSINYGSSFDYVRAGKGFELNDTTYTNEVTWMIAQHVDGKPYYSYNYEYYNNDCSINEDYDINDAGIYYYYDESNNFKSTSSLSDASFYVIKRAAENEINPSVVNNFKFVSCDSNDSSSCSATSPDILVDGSWSGPANVSSGSTYRYNGKDFGFKFEHNYTYSLANSYVIVTGDQAGKSEYIVGVAGEISDAVATGNKFYVDYKWNYNNNLPFNLINNNPSFLNFMNWSMEGICEVNVKDGYYKYAEGDDDIKGFAYKYRSISVNDPFPKESIPDNWKDWIAIPNNEARIKNTYDNGVKYSITLNENDLASIGGINYIGLIGYDKFGTSDFVNGRFSVKQSADYSYCDLGYFSTDCDKY